VENEMEVNYGDRVGIWKIYGNMVWMEKIHGDENNLFYRAILYTASKGHLHISTVQ